MYLFLSLPCLVGESTGLSDNSSELKASIMSYHDFFVRFYCPLVHMFALVLCAKCIQNVQRPRINKSEQKKLHKMTWHCSDLLLMEHQHSIIIIITCNSVINFCYFWNWLYFSWCKLKKYIMKPAGKNVSKE